MHRKRVRRIWGILKKSVSWELDSEREGSTFGARRGQTNLRATGAARDGGVDGKVIIKRLWISLPYVEEPLNSKVIKGFVPDLRNRYVFFVIPMFYVYMLWIFYVCFTYPYHGYFITIDYKMSSLPGTLWVLLTGFVSLAWCTAAEYTVLGQPDLAWSKQFFRPVRSFFKPSIDFIVINWAFIIWNYIIYLYILIFPSTKCSMKF